MTSASGTNMRSVSSNMRPWGEELRGVSRGTQWGEPPERLVGKAVVPYLAVRELWQAAIWGNPTRPHSGDLWSSTGGVWSRVNPAWGLLGCLPIQRRLVSRRAGEQGVCVCVSVCTCMQGCVWWGHEQRRILDGPKWVCLWPSHDFHFGLGKRSLVKHL